MRRRHFFFAVLTTIVLFTIIVPSIQARRGYVTIRVRRVKNGPVSGASIWVTTGAVKTFFGNTGGNGKVQGHLASGEYTAIAYYPNSGTHFGETTFTVDVSGTANVLIAGPMPYLEYLGYNESHQMPPSSFTGTLRVFEWGGYEDPDLWNAGLYAFKTLYPNVDVEFSFFVDEAEALSKLKLGFRPDIVHPCGRSIQRWYDAGVIAPLDISLIPLWQDVSSQFKEYADENAKFADENYFAPTDWGYSTVLYRPDLLEQLGVPEDKWDTYDLLFNPKLTGKVMVMDSAIEIVPMAALAAGVPVDNMWDMNEMEMTREKLLYQKLNLLRGYWTVPTQVVAAMASGEIAAASIWGESYVTLKGQGVNVTFSFPEEGLISWICGFSLVEGLKERDPDLYKVAHAFMNAWMDPQAGANLIDSYAYGHTNKYAHLLAERQDTVELLHFDDPAYLEQAVFWKYIRNEADWIAMWDEVKADPPREVVYEWYDFFDVPDPETGKLGEWYDVRGDHGIVRDEYPMVFWNEPSERLGDIWFYAPARLKVTGKALTELNMSDTNPKPQFVPLFAPDADSGGTVSLSFYLQYLTTEEWEATDGWIVKWTGTIELDKAAAKRVLNITDANYADISGWWETNKDAVESDWRDWLLEEARVRVDIYNMYMSLYSPFSVSLNCSRVGDLIVLDVEVVDWGGEALWARWFRDSFMPVEYWYEDMYFNATITPYHADVDLDTGVSYALYALDYGDGWAAWAFEAVLGDVLASSPAHNVSDFDLYVDPDTGEYWKSPYENFCPGNRWYGEADLTITYTPTGWNLKEGEQLIFQLPSSDLGLIPAYLHEGSLHYGSMFCENVTEIWGYGPDYVYMDTIEWNGFETSGPSSISYDPVERVANYTGPLDLFGADWWWWFPEYGCPYIELYYTETTRLDDVAITSVAPSEISVMAGDSVSIEVVVTNEGNMSETFNVTAYYDTTAMEIKTVISLKAGDNRTLTFTWDTTDVTATTYTISAEASILPDEIDTADNTFTDGTVTITMPAVLSATVNFYPDTLNLRSKGKWITACIELPESYNIEEIDVSTILLNDVVPAESSKVCGRKLMVRFDRSEVIALLPQTGEAELTITGTLFNGTPFEGSDTIRVR